MAVIMTLPRPPLKKIQFFRESEQVAGIAGYRCKARRPVDHLLRRERGAAEWETAAEIPSAGEGTRN